MTTSFKRTFFSPAHDQDSSNKYLFPEEAILAINVALSTNRPLLVKGLPGTGKSSIAKGIASTLGWQCLAQVVTSRTRARDLLWQFDAVKRLSDAQIRDRDLPPPETYVRPGVLWRAFDPSSAMLYPLAKNSQPAVNTQVVAPGCVVTIDEIDKADTELPNDLLDVIEHGRFTVDDLYPTLEVRGDRRKVLPVFATNGEREMPAAFVRRCVVLTLPAPDEDWLVRVAVLHRGEECRQDARAVAKLTIEVCKRAQELGQRLPGTAEFLDALQACQDLQIRPSSKSSGWLLVERVVLLKSMSNESDDGTP